MVPMGASKDSTLPKINVCSRKGASDILEYTKSISDVNKDASILHEPKRKIAPSSKLHTRRKGVLLLNAIGACVTGLSSIIVLF